jgi:hypothetical protein
VANSKMPPSRPIALLPAAAPSPTLTGVSNDTASACLLAACLLVCRPRVHQPSPTSAAVPPINRFGPSHRSDAPGLSAIM